MKKTILRYGLIFVITLMGLWLFLIGTAMISNDRIQENIQKSAYSYGQTDAFAFCDGPKWNGIADNYADSIWLNIAWYMGKGDPLSASLDTWYYDGENLGENAGLYRAVTEDYISANKNYTRYWHGTAGILRLMLLFTDVKGIKTAGLCLGCFLAAVVVVLLLKKKKGLLAAAFILSICSVEFWKIGLSIEYQPTFLLCFLMCIFYLLWEKKGDQRLIELSIISGVLTAFFDFLTTETIVLVMPLILVVAIRSMEHRLEKFHKSLKWIISCAFAWLMSYAMTFVAKWSLVSLVTGRNQFFSAFTSVEERINGSAQAAVTTKLPQCLSAVLSNLGALFGSRIRLEEKTALLGSLIVIGIFVSIYYLFQKEQRDKTADGLLFLLAGVIFIRYLVLGNHSFMHSFFTYRGLMTTIFALLCILILNCELPHREKTKK